MQGVCADRHGQRVDDDVLDGDLVLPGGGTDELAGQLHPPGRLLGDLLLVVGQAGHLLLDVDLHPGHVALAQLQLEDLAPGRVDPLPDDRKRLVVADPDRLSRRGQDGVHWVPLPPGGFAPPAVPQALTIARRPASSSLARTTAAEASAAYPSAPTTSAYSWVTGAPPTMTITCSRRPDLVSALMFALNIGMVVVRKAEKPTMSGWCSRTASTNFSGATCTPRSMTWNPAPSNMMLTRFLPMSCTSPLTVPMTLFPMVCAPVSASSGRRISSAPAIALPAMSISGTKKSPRSNRAPTSSSDGISASYSSVSGPRPMPRPWLVRSSTAGPLPVSVSS